MESAVATPAPARRLGVGHFLAWMLGCGVVLAIYRAGADFSEVPADAKFRWQLVQLGFGLAYGTAISGLGLFLYWRWRGIGVGPTQPGHWLLVFGGIGLLLDLGIYGGTQVASGWLVRQGLAPYFLHQWLGWSAAAAIGCVALGHLPRSSRWRRVALLVVGVLLLYSAAYGLSFVAPLLGIRGNWPNWTAHYLRAAGQVVCVPVVVLADIADRREGRPRDWLHTVGVLAIAALVAIDFAVNLPAFLR
jgi:hypothetical protein